MQKGKADLEVAVLEAQLSELPHLLALQQGLQWASPQTCASECCQGNIEVAADKAICLCVIMATGEGSGMLWLLPPTATGACKAPQDELTSNLTKGAFG